MSQVTLQQRERHHDHRETGTGIAHQPTQRHAESSFKVLAAGGLFAHVTSILRWSTVVSALSTALHTYDSVLQHCRTVKSLHWRALRHCHGGTGLGSATAPWGNPGLVLDSAQRVLSLTFQARRRSHMYMVRLDYPSWLADTRRQIQAGDSGSARTVSNGAPLQI